MRIARTGGQTYERTDGRTTFWDEGVVLKSFSCFKKHQQQTGALIQSRCLPAEKLKGIGTRSHHAHLEYEKQICTGERVKTSPNNQAARTSGLSPYAGQPEVWDVGVELADLPDLTLGKAPVYMTLEVNCGFLWTRSAQVLVSPKSGEHLFLQTNKPIYHPGSTGKCHPQHTVPVPLTHHFT